MIRSVIIKRAGWLWLLPVLFLAACGSRGEEKPLPTLANYDNVLPTLSPTGAPAAETVTETPTQRPTERPTERPSVTPSPTVLTTAQIEATGIALTNTAIAAVAPFTQTAETFWGATQTAVAGFSPTPSPTLTFTPEPEPFQVVFYTNRNGSDDIFLMTLNGVERALIHTAANEREPSCSPDGRSVVYASDASGSYQLYLLPLDGTIPIQLTNTTGLNFAPIFSPDGSRIAFVSTRSNGIPMIWMMNADGSHPQPVTTELGRDTSPSWGPDGRQLLFSSDQLGPWDLFLTILEDDVEGEFPVMPPGLSAGNQLWPVFDALGERIAYTTWDNLEDPQTADIYLLDFEQPEPVPVRAGPGADIAWAWGDDTHLLASVGGPDDVQIALVDITTGEAVPLTHAGTFNGGARLCTVQPGTLPPEPTPTPTLTPTPTETPAPTDTPAPTETPAPTPTKIALSPELRYAQKYPYIVQPGDTLTGIGKRYSVKWQDLLALNELTNPDQLSVGQNLSIPVLHTGPRPGGYQIDLGEDLIARKTIVVELGQQVVKAYEDGRLIKTVSVSTGLPGTPTVTGTFSIYAKYPSQTMTGPGYFLPGVPYVMYFFEGYGLHGTYWHNKFGQPMSHGCVNLPTEDAKWFYNWAEIGTPVLVEK